MPRAKASSGKRKVNSVPSYADSDWKSKTVAELKAECQQRQLDSTGKKADLVLRLKDDDDAGGGQSVAKLVKQESENTTQLKKAIGKLKQEPKAKTRRDPDTHCPLSSVQVYEDYDCMLNQTNIGNNNNKFYVIQLLVDSAGGGYYTWNRWGRVGEVGQDACRGPFSDVNVAIKDFEKKFKDKTKNDWEKRDAFVAKAGKYTLIEVEGEAEEEEEEKVETTKKQLGVGDMNSCTLDAHTQNLVKLIFADETFTHAMEKMELDVKKMPLGKLSKTQIAKGFDALLAIEDAVKTKKPGKVLETLTSQFYTLIPHSFGRQRPPVISDLETVQGKKDMLIVLSDIELAQTMQKEEKTTGGASSGGPHPIDVKYELLQCDLTYLNPKEKEFAIIDKYVKNTGYVKVLHVWRVDRPQERDRFKAHDKIDNRRLLWHGTNVAVVAAILKTGLRIMPHSGGRVGKGIYFASENSKSAGYVGYANGGIGIMFLNEVALGKEHSITQDDYSLEAPPKGFDCVIARGSTEPDEKEDVKVPIEGKPVVVPQGKPRHVSEYQNSYFSQSEYLVYKESQARIRYLIMIKC